MAASPQYIAGPLRGPGSEGSEGARLCRRLWPAGAGRLCRRVVNERVLRFDGPFGPKGEGIALRAMSFNAAYRRQRCHRQRKPYNRANARGNAPLLPTAGAVKKCLNISSQPLFHFGYRLRKLPKITVSCSPNCHLERSCMSI